MSYGSWVKLPYSTKRSFPQDHLSALRVSFWDARTDSYISLRVNLSTVHNTHWYNSLQ